MCVCCSLVAKQMEHSAMTNGFFLFLLQSLLATINCYDCMYIHTTHSHCLRLMELSTVNSIPPLSLEFCFTFSSHFYLFIFFFCFPGNNQTTRCAQSYSIDPSSQVAHPNNIFCLTLLAPPRYQNVSINELPSHLKSGPNHLTVWLYWRHLARAKPKVL